MTRIDFCKDWMVSKEGQVPHQVTLPHDAMQEERRSSSSEGSGAIAYYEGGCYRYEKRFEAPAKWKDKSISLYFEGVYRKSEVLINGISLKKCSNGYRGFHVSIQECLRFGEINTLTVIADNSEMPNSRYYSGSGIYRPVWLDIKEKVHFLTDGIRISTLSWSPALVRVAARHTGGEVHVQILDGGEVIAEGCGDDLKFFIPGARLWSDDNPYLYKCRVSLKDGEMIRDCEEISFGIRQLEWTEKGLLVNGKDIKLRGGCIHHDHGILGARCYKEAEYRRAKILKKAGYNAVRSAHNPISEEMLNACDELGIYVMDETWDHWFNHKNKYDYAGEILDEYREDIASLVGKDFNHPSVIMYSIGNEVTEPLSEKGMAFEKEIVGLLHEMDPSRPTTIGLNLLILAMRAKAMREERKDPGDSKRIVQGSQQFNAQVTEETGKIMNQAVASPEIDRLTSPALDAVDIAGYNYASGRYLLEKEVHPDRIVVGSETFPADIYQNWEMVKKLPYLIGDFMWAAWDYLGEVGIGSWGYGEEGKVRQKPFPWIIADIGTHDILGNPDGQAAYAGLVWGTRTDGFLGVRPVVHTGEEITKSAWRLTNAISSWSWNGCEGKKAEVEVFAAPDAQKVRLYINDKLMGEEKIEQQKALFNVLYEPGELRAEICNADNHEIQVLTLRSASGSCTPVMHPEKSEIRRREVLFVPIGLEDRNGLIECGRDVGLTVQVEGGELLAFGSADPKPEDSYLSDRCRSYYGRAMAVVRAKESEESIRLRVASDDNLFSETEIRVV